MPGPDKFVSTSNVDSEDLNCLHHLNDYGHVLASSEGLLLLLRRNPMSYHVYDLVSKKHIKLPETLTKLPVTVPVGFICNEQEIDVSHNIHRSRLNFKVVRLGYIPIFYAPEATRTVETFSSDIGRWRRSTMTAALGFKLSPDCVAKVIGGVFHWDEYGGKRTVAYNPDDPEGRVKLIELPEDAMYGIRGIGSGTQHGWLQFYLVHASINVWTLKGTQEGGSYLDEDEDVIGKNRWTFTHKISFLELGVCRSVFGPRFRLFFPFPIGFNPWNPNVIFLQTMDGIMSYDQSNREIEMVPSYRIAEYDPSMFVPFQWPCGPAFSF